MSLSAERVGKMVVRGRGLISDVAEAVVDGSVSLSIDGATQLDVTFADYNLMLFKTGLFDKGGALDYDNLKLSISGRETLDGDGGEQLKITARSLGWRKLKWRRGSLVRRRMSPTSFVFREARAVGLQFAGEQSAVRSQVARQANESSWDCIQRLATELGYVAFEAAGRLYFGRPTWLLSRPGTVKMWGVKWAEDSTQRSDALKSVPNCRDSEDSSWAAEVTVELLSEDADQIRPGDLFMLSGMRSFSGRYLVTDVTIPLTRDNAVTVTAKTPVNPTPEPPDPPTSSTTAKSSISGTSSAVEKFVAAAVAQAGDRYVYGAEARLSDPDPDAFDCSELVEWAAHQAGAYMPDGSSNQRAYCQRKGKAISIDKAIRTRGALLFANGHVAISLGNGRTIEASGRKYGVRQTTAQGRSWIAGGLVPGLKYP